MATRYEKIQKEVTRSLKKHMYSFNELASIICCGDKTLRRYIDAGIVKPATSGSRSNSQYFNQEQLERACFVFDMQKSVKMPIYASAALFDYLNARHMRFDTQDLLDRIASYQNDQ